MKKKISFLERTLVKNILSSNKDLKTRFQLISDISRLNALSAVKKAGSGHLGTSFSAIDIFTFLFFKHLNSRNPSLEDKNRDIFFSSKGHDSPALYSIFYSLGILSLEDLLMFRRLGGLDGHPDISINGVEANTGSLGMGISKAKGMAWAKKSRGSSGTIFVMTGDGELQEGQIFESLQTTKHQELNNIVVIVDHNKCQTENMVEDTISLGNLEDKFSSFGWHTERCDGHNFEELEKVFSKFQSIDDKPKVLIADTIKGKGISFMEHPFVLKNNDGVYKFHAGAPSDQDYLDGLEELKIKIEDQLENFSSFSVEYIDTTLPQKGKSGVSDEFIAVSFKDALINQALKNKEIVLLDADLLGDARLQDFKKRFPEQFIENGIAEQDMVSTAGGLALQGKIPFVNSFAAFLASRANEQIYNNSTELTKIIYINLYAGLIPAGPGKSHQSLRDIALMGSIPDMVVVQPSNEKETHALLNWMLNESENSCSIRLNIGPSPRKIHYDDSWKLEYGKGTVIREGNSGVIFAYGPVMLNEALIACEILKKDSYSLKVISMPWLNRFDYEWINSELEGINEIYILEDHTTFGGLGDSILNLISENIFLETKKFNKFGIDEIPKCGTPNEVLQYHHVDGASLSERILKISQNNEKE